jgi:hypothetical protein
MAVKYCSETVTGLQQEIQKLELHRPLRVGRFEPGTTLSYDVTAVGSPAKAHVTLQVKRFVGGGFAGQVYQVEILTVKGQAIEGLEVGAIRAMKILISTPGESHSVQSRRVVADLYSACSQDSLW